MDRLAHAQRYFDGWNAHDADVIAATFALDGTYADPLVQGLDPGATGAYAVGLAAAFPDLRFELVTSSLTDDGAVAAQWVMRGTNSGPFNGLPPTGREIALPGADFITFADDGSGIASVTGYFDSAGVPRDLGLQVIVQPKTIGPWTFGIASRASAGREAPAGAISLTLLLAFLFIVGGIFRAVGAASLRFPHWGWTGLSGFIALALGIMLLVQLPASSLWFLGLAVGIDLIFEGTGLIALGSALRARATTATAARA
jgi:steroid delta-isomerase-like uncharacterized protein